MPKVTESSLKSALMKVLRARLPGFVLLRHEDVRTSGIPDLSVTGLGCTTWWEFKYARPNPDSHGAQELTMLRLAASGYARYVVWEERGGAKQTVVLHPKAFAKFGELAEADTWREGFDHEWLASHIVAVHSSLMHRSPR